MNPSVVRVVRVAADAAPTLRWFVLYLAGHIILSYVILSFRSLAVVHALATAAVGIYFASQKRNLDKVMYVGAYIVGAEVLWRMSRVSLIYEFGKYSLVLIFVIALAATRRARWNGPALAAFALLLPSTVLTFAALDMELARKHLSFNLSGPLALVACICFLQNVPLTRLQVCRALMVYLGPAVGMMAFVSIRLSRSAAWVKFSTDSNTFTSGGFGPNQVSAVLGLGALCGFLCLLLFDKISAPLKALLFFVTIGLAAQSALTFSRGGLYCAVASAGLGSIALSGNVRFMRRALIFAGIAAVIGSVVVIPRLDNFTGGNLTARFESVDVTKRDVLVRDELLMWAENPILGVGPGMVGFNRTLLNDDAPAHTEFSRLLAEHGFLGAVSILILGGLMVKSIVLAKTREERAFRIAVSSWAVLFMMVNGMRVAAPSLLFGLAFMPIVQASGQMMRRRVVRLRRPSYGLTPAV